MTEPRRICIVVDTEGWFDPFAQRMVDQVRAGGDACVFVRDHDDIPHGDVAFFLSCTRLVKPELLRRNATNLVAHASALPQGRGFSPLVWQVLEGSSVIPISLIEAVEAADAGDIYLTDEIRFEGHELNDEMRERLGEAVVALCLRYLSLSPPPSPRSQVGEPSWYRRRGPQDSRLDPHAMLADQFDLLRVVDNARYPAFFEYRGRRFILKIHDDGPA